MASSLLRCTTRIPFCWRRPWIKAVWADRSLFTVASSASSRLSVTSTTNGTPWIEDFTRYWCVPDHLAEEFSHTGPRSIPSGGSFMVRDGYTSGWPPPGPQSSEPDLSRRLLEAAHSVCSWHFFYHYVIEDWGRTLALITEPIVWSVLYRLPGIPTRLAADSTYTCQGHWPFRSLLARSLVPL